MRINYSRLQVLTYTFIVLVLLALVLFG